MYLSEKVCRQLKDWGYKDDLSENEKESKILFEEHFNKDYLKPIDIRDIICDGEMAKKFFGEGTKYADGFEFVSANDEGLLEEYEWNTRNLLGYVQQNKQEEAEAYLMSKTVLNPLNKS